MLFGADIYEMLHQTYNIEIDFENMYKLSVCTWDDK